MSSWNDVTTAASDLAAAVQARFEATGLGFLATIRRDGSPRISGIEPYFWDGELWFGSMWEARKAADLRRDPRLALHAASVDKNVAEGDARISGRSVEVPDGDRKAAVGRAFAETSEFDPDEHGPWHLFRVEVTELVLVRPEGDALGITSWRPGEAVRHQRR